MPDQPEVLKWADKLDKLLQKAIAVRESDDLPRIAAVQRELRQFVDDSPQYADSLDTQARQTIFDLDLDVTEEAVNRIKERAAAVYRITKLINGIAEEANANADILGGALARQVIDTATGAISSFKQLRDELSSAKPDEKAIAALIDDAVKAVQTLRNKLEKR